jgi:hypothetical protein
MFVDEFKRLAFRYLRLAESSSDENEAARLRLLAADYWEKSQDRNVPTQQQQIQPERPAAQQQQQRQPQEKSKT